MICLLFVASCGVRDSSTVPGSGHLDCYGGLVHITKVYKEENYIEKSTKRRKIILPRVQSWLCFLAITNSIANLRYRKGNSWLVNITTVSIAIKVTIELSISPSTAEQAFAQKTSEIPHQQFGRAPVYGLALMACDSKTTDLSIVFTKLSQLSFSFACAQPLQPACAHHGVDPLRRVTSWCASCPNPFGRRRRWSRCSLAGIWQQPNARGHTAATVLRLL